MNYDQGQTFGTKEANYSPPSSDLNYQRKALESSFYIFPDSPEENKILKARAILGDIAINMSDEELMIYITQFEYLLNSWLDDYEKQIFSNQTLSQFLREG